MWNLITTALREDRILTFEYQGAYDEYNKPRRVRPYQLLFDSGVWYLYGFAEERNGVRLFSLCRIRNIVPINNHFSLPKDFDYRTENADSYFGVYMGQERRRFKIAIYDYSVVWVRDRRWAEDQRIEETDDGLIITFTGTQFDKVVEWLLSRGCTARPLEPELLVNVWRNHIDKIREMEGEK
jgi:predicted DNA-binding transcriptional regulator YafY